ncbi:MAG: pyridoxamine 5'-phosphate oxidase family protein, partial [Dermatophilaceae bacterium]
MTHHDVDHDTDHDGTSTDHDGAAKVHELIDGQRTAMLTTVHTTGGRLASRPMACQQADPDGTLWFLAFGDSEKA